MSNPAENEIAREVVDAAFHVHQQLGPGLLESVYETVLAHALSKRGLLVTRQVPVPVVYDGIRFDEGLRADLIVADKVIVELKSQEKIASVHHKQLLINFGSVLIKDGISRVVNGLPE